jgi:hypothetical protein
VVVFSLDVFHCVSISVYLKYVQYFRGKLYVCLHLERKRIYSFKLQTIWNVQRKYCSEIHTLSKWILCHFAHLIDLSIYCYKYKSLICEANDTKYTSLSKKYFSLCFTIHHTEK